MSDTTTAASGTEAKAEGGSGRSFDVNYTLEIVDELPAGMPRGGGRGSSPLNDQVSKVKAKVDEMGDEAKDRWMLIGRYGKPTAAGAAANVLRQRFGRSQEADGLEFAVRPIDGGQTRGLFVRYNPDKIVPGALDEHRRSEESRIKALAERRDERKAASAGGSNASDSTAANDNTAASAKAKQAAAKAAAASK